jgi:hypothetical protein
MASSQAKGLWGRAQGDRDIPEACTGAEGA